MNSVKKVAIIGGGSSGWMAASALGRLEGIEVTLVETSDIPVIGVGESTQVTIKGFNSLIGDIDEREFMRATDASFKHGIRFENFNRQGGVFFHPFGGKSTNVRDGFFRANAQVLHPEYHLASKGNQFSDRCTYSFQFDAGLYGEFLKKKAVKNGVRHVVDKIGNVKLGADGQIDYIETGKSGRLKSDLFIDCTGFRSLLLDKVLKEPFIDSSNYLINDSALAARVPYRNKAVELHPYTNCCALDAGWAWSIPLWSRIGTGYVYSSRFLTEAQAEEEFRRHLKLGKNDDVEFMSIKMRVGRHQRPWVGNCVGIGLSYGFIEPLESTGLSLTQSAIADLAFAISGGGSAIERGLYNLRQNQKFDRTRDFVLAHFTLTTREDTPYWKYVKYSNPVTDELLTILNFARQHSYRPLENWQQFYTDYNWNLILSGMDYFAESERPLMKPKVPRSTLHLDYLTQNVHGHSKARVQKRQKNSSIELHPTR